MTVLVDDPLIAAMAIRRPLPLPLHESSRRLRGLYSESPRAYGVAVMAEVNRRRWWPLESALTGRLQAMFDVFVAEIDSPSAAAHELAGTLVHAVIGRV